MQDHAVNQAARPRHVRVPVVRDDLLRARMPTPDELPTLDLALGVPVVRMLHIGYDPDGRTLPVADDLYAADRHEFTFEWSEPGAAV
jgi:DNA-binding GntR family transcriptional regulator